MHEDENAPVATVHVAPVNPAAQAQVKDPPLTEHIPPFWHGFGLQGSRCKKKTKGEKVG